MPGKSELCTFCLKKGLQKNHQFCTFGPNNRRRNGPDKRVGGWLGRSFSILVARRSQKPLTPFHFHQRLLLLIGIHTGDALQCEWGVAALPSQTHGVRSGEPTSPRFPRCTFFPWQNIRGPTSRNTLLQRSFFPFDCVSQLTTRRHLLIFPSVCLSFHTASQHGMLIRHMHWELCCVAPGLCLIMYSLYLLLMPWQFF